MSWCRWGQWDHPPRNEKDQNRTPYTLGCCWLECYEQPDHGAHSSCRTDISCQLQCLSTYRRAGWLWTVHHLAVGEKKWENHRPIHNRNVCCLSVFNFPGCYSSASWFIFECHSLQQHYLSSLFRKFKMLFMGIGENISFFFISLLENYCLDTMCAMTTEIMVYITCISTIVPQQESRHQT